MTGFIWSLVFPVLKIYVILVSQATRGNHHIYYFLIPRNKIKLNVTFGINKPEVDWVLDSKNKWYHLHGATASNRPNIKSKQSKLTVILTDGMKITRNINKTILWSKNSVRFAPSISAICPRVRGSRHFTFCSDINLIRFFDSCQND